MQSLAPSQRILDVGAGRTPTIASGVRPANCQYVGLDISLAELQSAPDLSYDEILCADITTPVPSLVDSFDLVICYQVLEHVSSLEQSFENMRRYLRKGGRLITMFSGKFALFALLNQAIPRQWTVPLTHRLAGRQPETNFPAPYDRCWYSAIGSLRQSWSTLAIDPLYTGAYYFGFFRPAQAVYIVLEEAIAQATLRNLATHYVVVATR
jgi:SAM-dependent methyltransferase